MASRLTADRGTCINRDRTGARVSRLIRAQTRLIKAPHGFARNENKDRRADQELGNSILKVFRFL